MSEPGSQAPPPFDPQSPPPVQPSPPLELKAEPFSPPPGGRVVDLPPNPPPPPPPQPPPEPPPYVHPPPPAGVPPGGAPPYTPPPAPPGAAPGAPPPPQRNQAWAMACHLGTLIDVGFTCLLVGFVPPLIIWLWKRETDPEVDYHGKESLNFQLNLLFWWIVSLPLICACGLGILIQFLLPFVKFVFVIVASLKSAEGARYRYPLTFRLIK